MGTRAPVTRQNLGQFVLTGRSALIACASCRNTASRSVEDWADQLEGRWFDSRTVKSGVMVPRVQLGGLRSIVEGLPLTGTRRIQVPSGKGGYLAAEIGAFTNFMEWEWVQDLTLPQMQAVAMGFRMAAKNLREKAADCCFEAVKRRVLRQTRPFTREPHQTTKRRVS